MGADQFTVENGLAAQALQAATVSPIAAEPWTDGSALLYSATDGRLHPVPVQPVAGAIVSVTGIAPIAVSPGVAPMVSLSGIVDEAHGGLGFDVSTLGTGLLKRTAPATYTVVADSLTVSAGAGLSGGGSVSLGGSTSLSLPNVGPGAGAVAFPASITLDAQGRVAAATAGSAPAALPLSRANGGLGSDVSALSTGLLAQTASNTWAVRSVAPGTGISVSNGDGVAGNPTVSVDSTVATLTGSQVLTNKTMSGASNSFSSIGNSSLTNSSLTVSAGTGLTGGGSVALGASTSLAVSYGTTAGTAAQGNDARLNPTPTTAGKIPYDTGSGYSETASAGSSTQVLHGGSTPAYGAVSLTADVSGTLPVANGGTGQVSLANHSVLIGALTGGISVAAQGTAGQVLTSAGASADPAMLDPITGTSAESVLSATYTVSADNGAYEDSGLSVTLPSAGTYFVFTQVRANIVAVTTAGAYLLAEYYNSTDAAAVANSEQMCAYGSTVGVSYYGMPTMVARISVNASKTIKLYVKSVAPTSTSTRTFNSDANGRTKMYYVKLNYV